MAAEARRRDSISTITAIDETRVVEVEQDMLMTKRKPATVGEILVEEFMQPLGLTQGGLAAAMGVQRKHVNELCNNRRSVTAPTALILARVFGNTAEFWLNVQRRNDLWEALRDPRGLGGLRGGRAPQRRRPLPRAASRGGAARLLSVDPHPARLPQDLQQPEGQLDVRQRARARAQRPRHVPAARQ